MGSDKGRCYKQIISKYNTLINLDIDKDAEKGYRIKFNIEFIYKGKAKSCEKAVENGKKLLVDVLKNYDSKKIAEETCSKLVRLTE